jgi:hypothetical protein
MFVCLLNKKTTVCLFVERESLMLIMVMMFVCL